MFKNHLKIALRNLLKQRGYTLINIAGLATGLACCWLILLFVQDELSYDRFHEKANRIFRATIHGRMAGNEVTAATSPVPMAAALMADYPEVISVTRIKHSYNTVLVGYGVKKFNEQQVYFADSTFFEIFTFPLIAGEARTALREPFSVVLTEEMARKYFGQENPLGKILRFNNAQDFKITGIAKNVPSQSHFHFDFLVSFNSWGISRSTVWTSNHLYTYLLLQENYPVELLAAKLPDLVKKYVGPQMQESMGVTYEQFVAAGGIYAYSLQPLEQIHLHSQLTSEIEPNSDSRYVTIFSLIAFFANLNVGFDFIETLGLELVAGRSFSRAHGTDSTAFIINEAMARKMGWREPLGKIIINPGAFKGPVIGVVKDFHYESLHKEIQPAVLNLSHDGIRFIAARIAPAQVEATMADLRNIWQRFAPEQPFEYSFLDADFDKLYRADQRTGKISATFSALSVFIACLGLFGLASFSSEQRTKEIGVRKVLGASVGKIIILLSKEFTQLVLLAFVLASAPAYFFMNKWLQAFAYRTELGPEIFLLAGTAALAIALLTVSYQSVKAALANPVEALRYE
jgi:hypothetical protein